MRISANSSNFKDSVRIFEIRRICRDSRFSCGHAWNWRLAVRKDSISPLNHVTTIFPLCASGLRRTYLRRSQQTRERHQNFEVPKIETETLKFTKLSSFPFLIEISTPQKLQVRRNSTVLHSISKVQIFDAFPCFVVTAGDKYDVIPGKIVAR